MSNPLLEPGAKAAVIVPVNSKPAPGQAYSRFDVMRANPIDAPDRGLSAGM